MEKKISNQNKKKGRKGCYYNKTKKNEKKM